MNWNRRTAAGVLAVLTLAVLILAACGPQGPGGRTGAQTDPDHIDVVVSFYPLQYVVHRVAGRHAAITDLTKPGTEPHDLELTPQDIASVADADLVVYLSRFQPAVDDAVGQQDADRRFDVAPYADLVPAARHGITGGAAASAGDGLRDPHFWLDPHRLARVARHVAVRLARVDPDHSADYRAGAEKLVADLGTLDTEYRARLRSCRDRRLVTSHTAFGYLADRYRLHQVGIAGLSPEDEPKPAEMARAVDLIRSRHIHTVYAEALVSPAIAKTLATESGARMAVLDPIEGITDRSAGDNYLEVMRANLATLLSHQDCH